MKILQLRKLLKTYFPISEHIVTATSHFVQFYGSNFEEVKSTLP